jgi:hypothetical protein
MSVSCLARNKTLPCPTPTILYLSPCHLLATATVGTYGVLLLLSRLHVLSHNNTRPATVLSSLTAKDNIYSRPPVCESPYIPSLGSFLGVLEFNISTRRFTILRVNALRARKAFCMTRTPASDDSTFTSRSTAAVPTFMYR